MQVHVGDDKVLLDEAVRYEAAAPGAGGAVDVHVCKGMIHALPANVAMLAAAGAAMDLMSSFIRSLPPE